MEIPRDHLSFSNTEGKIIPTASLTTGTMEDPSPLPISLKCPAYSCPLLEAQKPVSQIPNLQNPVRDLRSQIRITMVRSFLSRVCLGYLLLQNRTLAHWCSSQCCVDSWKWCLYRCGHRAFIRARVQSGSLHIKEQISGISLILTSFPMKLHMGLIHLGFHCVVPCHVFMVVLKLQALDLYPVKKHPVIYSVPFTDLALNGTFYGTHWNLTILHWGSIYRFFVEMRTQRLREANLPVVHSKKGVESVFSFATVSTLRTLVNESACMRVVVCVASVRTHTSYKFHEHSWQRWGEDRHLYSHEDMKFWGKPGLKGCPRRYLLYALGLGML